MDVDGRRPSLEGIDPGISKLASLSRFVDVIGVIGLRGRAAELREDCATCWYALSCIQDSCCPC